MPNKYNGKRSRRAATARETAIQERNPMLRIVCPWWGVTRTMMAAIAKKDSGSEMESNAANWSPVKRCEIEEDSNE